MSLIDREIAGAIAQLGKAGKYEIFEGVVSKVNVDERTVDVEIEEGVELFDIKLRTVVGGKDGLVLLPKMGSVVAFAQVRGEDDFILVSSSELDKIIIEVEVAVEITSPSVLINDGDNGGVPIESKVVEELNALQKEVNELKALLTGWVPAGTVADGTALKGIIASWAAAPMSITAPKALENDKVKH